MKPFSVLLLIGFIAMLGLFANSFLGCKPAPTGKTGEQKSAPDPVVVSAAKTTLAFHYLDQNGQFQTVRTIEEVPQESRVQVVVVDESADEQGLNTTDYVHVADLTQQQEDGTYPVRVMDRNAFSASLPKVTPSKIPTEVQDKPEVTSGANRVIMYSTQWCGVCRKARSWFKKNQIPIVEKDIEKSRAAAEELQRKAEASRIRADGVPVIDVNGQLISGFDPSAIRKYLR